ncbi:MAG: hypothetical protein ACM3XM_21365 [Mycobacterium leprae]
MKRILLLLTAFCLLAGCSAQTPHRLLANALQQPPIAQWMTAHSSPAVLAAMSPQNAKRWRRYKPAATLDRVKEGLLIKLEAAFGPEPLRLQFVLDRVSGTLVPLQPH